MNKPRWNEVLIIIMFFMILISGLIFEEFIQAIFMIAIPFVFINMTKTNKHIADLTMFLVYCIFFGLLIFGKFSGEITEPNINAVYFYSIFIIYVFVRGIQDENKTN